MDGGLKQKGNGKSIAYKAQKVRPNLAHVWWA